MAPADAKRPPRTSKMHGYALLAEEEEGGVRSMKNLPRCSALAADPQLWDDSGMTDGTYANSMKLKYLAETRCLAIASH